MTDNTEAVEKLAEIVYEASQYPDAYSTAAKTILAAIQAAPLAYVKPKPISWGKDCNKNEYHGNTSFGPNYLVFKGANGFWKYRAKDSVTTMVGFDTFEVAQAAAETHRNEMLAKEFE